MIYHESKYHDNRYYHNVILASSDTITVPLNLNLTFACGACPR